MSNPVQRLKLIPWLGLLQVAGLTILLVTFLDGLLAYLYATSQLVRDVFGLLFAPPLGNLLLLAIAVAVGAFAVYVMERGFQHLTINVANLWALVFCVAITLSIRSALPVPGLLGADQTTLIGMMLGVFLGSWKYWRSPGGYRR